MKKEIISFLNLSSKELYIEMAFSNWVNKFSGIPVVLIENDLKYSSIRELDDISKDDYLVPIHQFNNPIEYVELINKLDSNMIVSSIDYKNDYIPFLKHITTLFVIIENEKQIDFSSKITSTLNQLNKEININYIFLTTSKILPKEFIFFNTQKIQKTTVFKKNLNQITFSKMLSKLNL